MTSHKAEIDPLSALLPSPSLVSLLGCFGATEEPVVSHNYRGMLREELDVGNETPSVTSAKCMTGLFSWQVDKVGEAMD